MKLTRIYASADGESHIAEIDLPAETPGERAVTAFVPALRTGFGVVSVSGAQDWHPAHRRQLATVLSGALEIECSDGSARRFGPGESFIADGSPRPRPRHALPGRPGAAPVRPPSGQLRPQAVGCRDLTLRGR